MLKYEDYQLINDLKQSDTATCELIRKISDYSLETASHGCHDLRNHAALISSYCQLLSMQNPSIETEPFFQKIQLSTNNLIRLFDEIALFRYSFTPNQISETNILSLISNAISYVTQKFNIAPSCIATNFESSLNSHPFNCNSSHITNAIQALLTNSIEACSSDNIKISISATLNNDFICLIITDNGKGFSDEMLETGCKPFKTDKKEHSGLGLAIASTTIYKHNGNLKIANISGGSQITILLPC